MKIIEKFEELSVEELTEQAKAEGISTNRLDGAFSSTFLPDKGKFEKVAFNGFNVGEIQPDGKAATENTKHIVLVTSTGEQISLGRLQASGFVGTINPDTDILESRSGSFYLRSNTTPNPALTGNQIVVAKKLIGKNFTAKPVELQRTKFVAGGYATKDEHQTQVYKTYELAVR